MAEASEFNSGNPVRRYLSAIAIAGVALILRQLLTPFLGENNPYHTVWPAVVLSAWYCGLGPSIVTAVLSLLGVWYLFLPPKISFTLQEPRNAISGMIGFLFFSGLIIALGEANRRSLERRKLAEAEVRKAHGELEQKVRERTEDLRRANESLRDLSGRLQQMRDEERRQIARELHDSVGQLVSALGMNLAVVQRQTNRLDSDGARAVSDNAALIEQISREVRTISHLLHPPLLEAAGLTSALRWYVDGFSERSKIKVNLEVPNELARLSDELEIAIFRMVQECLTNIHRHSGGNAASIRMWQVDHELRVEVADKGKGIPLEKQLELSSSNRTGVGFRGMRERMRQLGGSLDIRSDTSGTVVTAAVPLPDANPASAQAEIA